MPKNLREKVTSELGLPVSTAVDYCHRFDGGHYTFLCLVCIYPATLHCKVIIILLLGNSWVIFKYKNKPLAIPKRPSMSILSLSIGTYP